MPNTRLPMRKIREVLRLHNDFGLGQRAIARSCGIGRSTVIEYLWRAGQEKLAWPLPAGLSDAELELKLFPPAPVEQIPRPLPDFTHIHSELIAHKRFNLTLDQLWCEYKEQYPDGYQYSRYCELYRGWLGKRDYCMRQDHKAGEKVFVDYGDGLEIWDKTTGEPVPTHLFVAVWGASNYTYAEAALSQDLASWCGSHRRAFEHFGCVPRVVVPDNLKSAVTKASYYEPEINATYAELAEHYGCAVIPARPNHPRDKPKVETGVLIAKRWILAKLRHRTFYSLAELNAAVRELLEALNNRLLRKLKKSRVELFEALDRPAAQPLNERPYEYAEWKKARVNVDYHIEVESRYYSVPFRLIREEVDVRLTAGTVEVFRKGELVTAHARSRVPHSYTTKPEHMPLAHQKHLEWTPTRIIEWAGKTGPFTAQLVNRIMAGKAHPEQGYRACLGVLRLGKSYGAVRLEAAAGRALHFNACTFQSVRSILTSGLDRQRYVKQPAQTVLPFHENIRGGQYYSS